MTNETKPSIRRQVIEIVTVLAVVAFVLAFPVTRAMLGVSVEQAVAWIGQIPGQVWDSVTNVWNWIF